MGCGQYIHCNYSINTTAKNTLNVNMRSTRPQQFVWPGPGRVLGDILGKCASVVCFCIVDEGMRSNVTRHKTQKTSIDIYKKLVL